MGKNIIALDLDETLLNDNKELTERTLDVLFECEKRGAVVVISSTRGYGSCKAIAKKIGASYVCCHAGNMIVEMGENEDEVIFSNGFTHSDVSELIDEFLPYTKNFVVDSVESLYGGIGDEFAKIWGIIPCTIEELKKKDAYKMCIYYDETYVDLIKKYCDVHGFVCRPMRGSSFMFISPANSDKFYALEKLCEILGTDLEYLFVFGDDNSDLLSIKKAKYGVAVANSKPEVLAAAKFLTESNNEDGVAKFLEREFLS